MKIPSRQHDGQFHSFEEWVNKACSWIGGTNPVCFDAKDRICAIGRDFMLARDEDAFPVRFWYGEGKLTAKEHRKSIKQYHAAMRINYPWRYS